MNKGDIVKSKIALLGNPKDTIGVVYEEYTIGDRGGVSVIFSNGEYDGFSPEEQEAMLQKIDFDEPTSNYQFVHVIKLNEDFENGVFDSVFKKSVK